MYCNWEYRFVNFLKFLLLFFQGSSSIMFLSVFYKIVDVVIVLFHYWKLFVVSLNLNYNVIRAFIYIVFNLNLLLSSKI